jgi:gliding motility-associated-like protein
VKKYLLVIVWLFLLERLYGQNLVPNPSFELYSNCPTGDSQLGNSTGCLDGSGSPDYLHTCSSSNYSTLPTNYWGTEAAATGNACVGALCYGSFSNNYLANNREYIYMPLASPLVIGTSYYVSFKVNLADNSSHAINNIGIQFTGLAPTSNFPINNTAHVFSSNVISTTNGWTTISGNFVATAPFTGFYIGNHFDDASSSVQSISASTIGYNAYYFFDDIEVIAISPIVTISGDTSICLGNNSQLVATSSVLGLSYRWTTSLDTSIVLSTNSTIVVAPTATTTYLVQVGGIVTSSFIINVIAAPPLNLGPDTTLCLGDQIQLDATALECTYTWQDGSQQPTYEVNTGGTYSVEVSNQCGTTSDEIIVEDSDCLVFIPNAFSPNGDDINDLFKPIGLNKSEIIQFRIYNRWGQEVFNVAEVSSIGWNGQFMETNQPSEVYLYVLEYKRRFEEKSTLIKGEVTLLQ